MRVCLHVQKKRTIIAPSLLFFSPIPLPLPSHLLHEKVIETQCPIEKKKILRLFVQLICVSYNAML